MREYAGFLATGLAMAIATTGSAWAQPAAMQVLDMRYEGSAPIVPDGYYANPVLPGFHPDPSIVGVGPDFYLVTSTFSWFPGLPVFHSRDLVNWTQIGNAIDRPGMVDMRAMSLTGDGLYAPAITHHGDTFYILNTCVRCDGNFLVTAKDPAGPWSDPVPLAFDGIDPSLFVDSDGRGWITYNDAPIGEPRYDGHRAIWIREIDLTTLQLTGTPTLLVDGGVRPQDNPVWAEGPHIYSVDGWYYLLAAEGGTADQHSQTIYRSRAITGPYEPGPVNPILTQRDLSAARKDRVEATGHADFVKLEDGSWWSVFLATRPFAAQDTLLGRETFLLPVNWSEGWPAILPHGEPVPLVAQAPQLPSGSGTDWNAWEETFDNAALGHEWLRMRGVADTQRLALSEGALIVIPSDTSLAERGMPSFVGRRLRHPTATIDARIDFTPQVEGDFGGIAAVASETAFLAVGRTTDGITLLKRDDAADPVNGEVVARAAAGSGPVDLRIAIDRGTADVSYRRGTGSWTLLAEGVDVSHMASVRSNLFTGVVVGPYAYSATD